MMSIMTRQGGCLVIGYKSMLVIMVISTTWKKCNYLYMLYNIFGTMYTRRNKPACQLTVSVFILS